MPHAHPIGFCVRRRCHRRLLLADLLRRTGSRDRHTAADLGAVSFPISCRPELQPAFERAVALQHSFEFEAAREAFERVAADDRHCAMAHWGIAMSLYHPLWAAPTPAEMETGGAGEPARGASSRARAR